MCAKGSAKREGLFQTCQALCVCVRVCACVCVCACVLETDGLPADWDLKWDLAHDGDTKPGRRAFYLEEGEGFKC